MALREPAVLNAALAVAASHHSRWQHTTDVVSRRYLRAASTALRDRFSKPEHIHSEVTLAAMLLLVTFEVFSGSSRWKGHYDAIRGWIRSRGSCADLDPFLKTWVCLVDTQSSLNMGNAAMAELEPWLDVQKEGIGQETYIDALFGCSSRLLKSMVCGIINISSPLELLFPSHHGFLFLRSFSDQWPINVVGGFPAIRIFSRRSDYN